MDPYNSIHGIQSLPYFLAINPKVASPTIPEKIMIIRFFIKKIILES